MIIAFISKILLSIEPDVPLLFFGSIFIIFILFSGIVVFLVKLIDNTIKRKRFNKELIKSSADLKTTEDIISLYCSAFSLEDISEQKQPTYISNFKTSLKFIQKSNIQNDDKSLLIQLLETCLNELSVPVLDVDILPEED